MVTKKKVVLRKATRAEKISKPAVYEVPASSLLHNETNPASHPLMKVFEAAVTQAMFGKGQRHGGNVTPFLDQPWVHYAKMHGRGFLTGQAAKKLEEAAATRTGEAFETEVFGAMVYLGMAILKERGEA
jgi:hypothetical protein